MASPCYSRVNINNTLRAFLSRCRSFSRVYFPCPHDFSFSPYFARFLGWLLRRLLSRFLFIAHTTPRSDFCRIYGHILPRSLPRTFTSPVVIYVFFALRPNGPALYWPLDRERGICDASFISVILLKLIKWFVTYAPLCSAF